MLTPVVQLTPSAIWNVQILGNQGAHANCHSGVTAPRPPLLRGVDILHPLGQLILQRNE